MNSSSNTSSKKNNAFCKVCRDAGKSEAVYTSHYVKDAPGKEGKVICPYLLSLVCSYCKKAEGHTASHCPVLSKNKEHRETTNATTTSARPEINNSDDGWTTVKSAKRTTPEAISKRTTPEAKRTTPVKERSIRYDVLEKSIEREETRVKKNEEYGSYLNTNFPSLKKLASNDYNKPPPVWVIKPVVKPVVIEPAVVVVAPAVAEVAPAVVVVAPPVAEVAPPVSEVAPPVAEVAPPVVVVEKKLNAYYGTYNEQNTAVSWADDDY